MNLKIIMIVFVAMFAISVNGPVFAAYSPPLQGEVLVQNDLALDPDGRCSGEVAVSHAPREPSTLGRLVLSVQNDCAVELAWQDATGGLIQARPSAYSVITEFQNMTADAYVRLTAPFNHPANACPVPIEGGALIAQSAGITPGLRKADNSLDRIAPEPSGPSAPEPTCHSVWLQHWTALESSSSPYPVYIVKSIATQVGGVGIIDQHSVYACSVNGKMEAQDPRVHCTRWPLDAPSAGGWDPERKLGVVEAGDDGVLQDEIVIA